ncbi:MAG: hypothetical protein K6A31_00840 [Fibrobacter sp.]|nr:hypothetical protein [Fibrobacter sp.]
MATTVDSLRKAIGKKKQSQAFAWLADLMRLSGDLDGALQCVQSGLQAFPESVEGQLVLSKILEEKQDLDGVIQACEAVLLRNPYCLSALRRLGDAFASKGDEGNRNYYYQLLHDLDPLDPFWKEEYAPQIDMASMTQDTTLGVAGVATAAAAEPSLDAILKDEPLDLGGESLFEKAPEAPVAEVPAPEAPAAETSAAEETQTSEDDPFSALSSLIPADEEKDAEVSFDDLEHSLDDAIAGFAPTDTAKDQFPMDEIDGSDVSSALTGIFGASEMEDSTVAAPAVEEAPVEEAPVVEEKAQSLSDAFDDIFGEDELPEEFVPSKPAAAKEEEPVAEETPVEAEAPVEAETPVAEAAPSADEDILNLDEPLPTLDDKLEVAEEKSEVAEEKPEESLEGSVENSLDSLFGKDDDDLPLEGGFEKSSSAEVELPKEEVEEKSEVAEEKPEESLEGSVENSLDNLFGKDDDDLPLEGGFEKSSSAEVELPKEEVEEKSEVAEEKPEESLEGSVEKSRDSHFGKDDDDRPLEAGLAQPSSAQEELPKEEVEEKPEAAEEKPEESLEGSVENSLDSLFGKDDDDLPLEGGFEKSSSAEVELPKEEVEEKSEVAEEKPEESLEGSVENSLDNLFGKDDDDLPLEGGFEKSSSAEVELPKEEVEEKSEVAEEKPEESLEGSVENSLDSLFGKDDDDLPLEGGFEKSSSVEVELPKEEVEAKSEVAEEKPEESLEGSVENSLDSLFGKDDDDLPLEGGFEKSPSAEVELPKEEALETSVESSFDNLFGKDSDELSLDELKLDEDAPAAEAAAPAEVKSEPAVESSVDSSFDSIFGKDSDDALLEDPTTSTRTLAEIYFGQGVYDEAIKIYKDLLRKNPESAELKQRLAEIEKIRNDKNLN